MSIAFRLYGSQKDKMHRIKVNCLKVENIKTIIKIVIICHKN